MALPKPEPGLVINFNYLWSHEAAAGRDNARYPRPCAIVVARYDTSDGPVVLVAPITHSVPKSETAAVEIPAGVKRALGLDDQPSWIVTDEVNAFVWPGFDLEPNARGEFAYGFLPPRLFGRVKASLLEQARGGRLSRVPR